MIAPGVFVRHRRIGMFLLGLTAISVAGEARAHPHIFIDDAMTVIFGDHDIAGLRLSWTFDEMYSSMIKTDYVHGKTMTPTEMMTVEKENFLNLGNYGFFLDLTINGTAIKVKEVKDFGAKFEGNKIVFEFTVPLSSSRPNAVAALAFWYAETDRQLPARSGHLTIRHGMTEKGR